MTHRHAFPRPAVAARTPVGRWSRRLRLVVVAAALAELALLSGCSLTPALQRPTGAAPAQFPAEAVGPQTRQAPVDASQLPWREQFTDPRLRSLIATALANNRDLRVAMLNVEAVRAAYDIQRAERFPNLNLSATGTRQPSTQAPYRVGTSAQAGLAIPAFEIDLFGRVQALTEAAAAQLLATQEAQRTAHIGLVASVAGTWYTLWADRWQLALAEQTLASRQAALKLQQLKFDQGVLNELELRSAQSLVEAARVARAQAQRAEAQSLQALALLMGYPQGQGAPAEWLPSVPGATPSGKAAVSPTPPGGWEAWVQQSLWAELDRLPVNLSSEVLLQRPDIAQAEQLLVAANANIGAARAARFPRLTLTTSAGVVSDAFSGLFDSGRFAWSAGGSLAAPIFDMGRSAANVDAAVARRDIAIAQYDKAVQSAFKEVADALVTRRTYAEQAEAQRAQAVAEAARLRLAQLRYDNGVASQLDLLDAQRNLFGAQQAHIQAQLALQQAHIGLYKALGGGWVAE